MLRKIQKDEFEQFHSLLEDNFPKSERRTKEAQRALLELDAYQIYVETKDRDIVGFFAEWSNDSLRFIEHLAVNIKFRGSGTGSRLLNEYLELSDKPVLLEVEPPEDDIQQRRVSFYEKNRFNLTPYGYMQPPLYKGEDSVPLVLMCYPDPLSADGFDTFKAWSLETIYHPDNK